MTLTVELASKPEQPAVPRTVYVIVADPAPIAKTSPVTEFTVATKASDVVQVPPATVDDAVVELPEHKVASTIEAVPGSEA